MIKLILEWTITTLKIGKRTDPSQEVILLVGPVPLIHLAPYLHKSRLMKDSYAPIRPADPSDLSALVPSHVPPAQDALQLLIAQRLLFIEC
ncbi:unnamed protein product [Pieris brassicae]|uniref:Uncharacterized protein n=1 Tax=Pieris brassicae TaxID=7116 RepID=A0A9P0X379_PIEBR|nr:unnamed protein product [Pieris brassicae]